MRPGFVLEVDERTPPLLVHQGDGVLLERFPVGTRVVYPPLPRPGVDAVGAAVDAALAAPVGSAPLVSLLRPGLRLVLVVSDAGVPAPRMRGVDVRARLLERVLSVVAAAGVDEVRLVVATGLGRRRSAAEVEALVGERVFRSFWPQRLACHDAFDEANLVEVGVSGAGEVLRVARPVAEADLLISVEVVQDPGVGGLAGLAAGVASYGSLRAARSVSAAMRDAAGWFSSPTPVDSPGVSEAAASSGSPGPSGSSGTVGVSGSPGLSEVAGVAGGGSRAVLGRLGGVLAGAVPVFAVTATVNAAVGPAAAGFLTGREWEWSLPDQVMALAAARGLDRLGGWARRRVWQETAADYAVTSVGAGDVRAVTEAAWALVEGGQRVGVEGQTDVLVVGSAPFGVHHGSGAGDAVLGAHGALAEVLGRHTGRPVVREHGAMIVYHPMAARFSQVHQPSYVDFYAEVLAESHEPATIEAKFERQYATDPWYESLYRSSLALPGVHPFHRWYETAPGRAYLGEVVVVGGDRVVCARLGLRAASTLADALEIVSGSVGRDPSVTYLHAPPRLVADVR
ncbi:nickel-dependent lactate racemase [Frankia sp. Ag45/Mut15]|uniref:Nickel-dependent lactate racemase n=1 Tax=Frankia umida TaxID=573489 RepID=A0ABT0K0H0_9ACTN|nr:lactate racemase domain-containing protein [Frankia umida]MCK9877276.1 nickel-dependent lactate racemase [Frankia umida]